MPLSFDFLFPPSPRAATTYLTTLVDCEVSLFSFVICRPPFTSALNKSRDRRLVAAHRGKISGHRSDALRRYGEFDLVFLPLFLTTTTEKNRNT